MPRYPTVSLKKLGQRKELSSLDSEKVNEYYGCGTSGRRVSEPEDTHRNYYMAPIIKEEQTTTTIATVAPLVIPRIYSPRLKGPHSVAMVDPPSPCDKGFKTNAMLSTLDDNMIIMSCK